MAIDQQAGFIVDRQAERPADTRHAALAEPALGGGEQALEHRAIVDALDETEMAGRIMVAVEIGAVDLGADAPDGPALAQRQPIGDGGMIEIGIFSRVQMIAALEDQRRDPPRVVGVERERDADETLDTGGVADLLDAEISLRHGRRRW